MENEIKKIIEELMQSEAIRPEDIPDIGLYMDQVTTFMETHLADSRRYEDDKIMTKTMINNYSKNRLLPPSEKKKYSREHVLLLIMIYYMKSFLTISDIQTMLGPLTTEYFQADPEKGMTVTEIYRDTMENILAGRPGTREELSALWDETSQVFDTSDMPEKDSRYLNDLAYIYRLSYDIYIRKQLIGKLIDRYREATIDTVKKGKEKKPSKKARPKS